MYTKNTAIECQLSPPLPKFGPFPAKNGQAPKNHAIDSWGSPNPDEIWQSG